MSRSPVARRAPARGAGGGAARAAARIVILPGDGIGPEVTAAAVRVLRAVSERAGHTFTFDEALVGGAAIDATGSPLPDETVALCRSADAVLLGAVGGPKWDDPAAPVRPEQGLLGLRKTLGVFANLRPVVARDALAAVSPLKTERLAGVNLLVVRELTGGIYFGEKRRGRERVGGDWASDVCRYSADEIERVVRVAATLARARRRRLTSVDKANVLETSRLWRSVTNRVVRDEFPDVTLDHLLVDTCAMDLLRRPSVFDVIVTENMFGDILTDEASMLAGSMGLLPSASLGAARDTTSGPRWPGLYEPIHGSAPDIAGRGVANPMAAMLSAALLLRYSLGLEEDARAVERSVEATISDGIVTADIASPPNRAASTSAVADAVLQRLRTS